VNFASLFSGLLLGYSLAVPPGPMNALIAAWSLRSFRHGFAVGAGAMSADFLLMLLGRDVVGKGWGKKRLIRLQVHLYRYRLTGIITPVVLYLSVFTCGEKAYIAKQKKRHG